MLSCLARLGPDSSSGKLFLPRPQVFNLAQLTMTQNLLAFKGLDLPASHFVLTAQEDRGFPYFYPGLEAKVKG